MASRRVDLVPPVPPAAAAETDTVAAAAATAVPSARPVPGPGPQGYRMASDESADEGGDDSFPDFPVAKQDVKMADDAQPQTQAAGEEEPQERFENGGTSTFSAQPPAAPEKLAEAEPASVQPPSTPPASDLDPTPLFTDPEKAGGQRIIYFCIKDQQSYVNPFQPAMSLYSPVKLGEDRL